MTEMLQANKDLVSACVFTQATDVENECDGMYTMDRVNKLDAGQLAAVRAANGRLISAGAECEFDWLDPIPGFIGLGGDCITNGSYTLPAAKARCAAAPDCRGITFKAGAAAPTGVIPNVYFKNQTNVAGGSGWWSHIHCV